MSEPNDKRADVTRRQILSAAAHQFAHQSYSQVSLDDILADAQVTKGAMYFHFRSKYALAAAVIDEQLKNGRSGVNEIVARRLSGLETLVDISYLIAVQDLSQEVARAGFNLIESIGRTDGMQAKLHGAWMNGYAGIVQRAIEEGDVREDVNPEITGRILVGLYMGLRQTSDLSDSRRYFTDIEWTWLTFLPGLAQPDRIGYLTQFVKRRTTVAINTVPLAAVAL